MAIPAFLFHQLETCTEQQRLFVCMTSVNANRFSKTVSNGGIVHILILSLLNKEASYNSAAGPKTFLLVLTIRAQEPGTTL